MEAEGWWVSRAAGSLGDADLVALKVGELARLVEVKSNKGSPFMHFRRADREALISAAVRAGAIPWLVHWPPRQQLRWIPVADWPPNANGAPEDAVQLGTD